MCSKFQTLYSVFLFVLVASLPCLSFAEANLAWPNLTEEEFKSNVETYRRKGFVPIDFEVIVGINERTYSLVMEKFAKKTKSILRSQLEIEEFKDTWQNLLRKGYRPIDIESYEFQKRQYFGSVWIKDRSVSWSSYESLTSKQFDLVTEEARSNNKIPVDINSYLKRGRLTYSGIFQDNKRNNEWILDRKVAYEDFDSRVSSMYENGFCLIVSSLYSVGDDKFFLLAWEKNPIDWKVETNLDAGSLEELIQINNQNGYYIVDIEVKRSRSGLLYTGRWTEPTLEVEESKSGLRKLFGG